MYITPSGDIHYNNRSYAVLHWYLISSVFSDFCCDFEFLFWFPWISVFISGYIDFWITMLSTSALLLNLYVDFLHRCCQNKSTSHLQQNGPYEYHILKSCSLHVGIDACIQLQPSKKKMNATTKLLTVISVCVDTDACIHLMKPIYTVVATNHTFTIVK